MNPAGFAIAILGVMVITQVLAGQALQRLRILS